MKLKPEWEENLRRVVIRLGKGLESLITKIQSSRAVQKIPKVTPVLSIEGQLPTPKVRELAQHVSLRLLTDMIPPLVDKSVLLVGEGITAGVPLCHDKGVSTLVQVELSGSESPLADGDDELRIHCRPHHLAVRSGSFDTVIALLATPFQGELEQALQELARTLVVGGDFLLADFHPFGLYAKRGSHRLRASFAHGIEDYYRMARGFGIDLTDCREGFCDEKAAAFFATPDEKQIYRRIKDSPLVIAFRGRKLGDVK
jgi:SAM-dependent methyltransferase